MRTHKPSTYYPAKWTAARSGDVLEFTTRNPWTYDIADAVVIHDARTGAPLVTGHVVTVEERPAHVAYEIRVNVNHVTNPAAVVPA